METNKMLVDYDSQQSAPEGSESDISDEFDEALI